MNVYIEAVIQRCSVKKVFLEISQNLQENTCASKIKVAFPRKHLCRESNCEFCRISRYTFLHRKPLMAAFVYIRIFKKKTWHRQSNSKLRWRESAVELTLSPRVFGSQVSRSHLIYSLRRPIDYCCRSCTILWMILKKNLFIEALCRLWFRKYAQCKPLFPFQSNA